MRVSNFSAPAAQETDKSASPLAFIAPAASDKETENGAGRASTHKANDDSDEECLRHSILVGLLGLEGRESKGRHSQSDG